MAKKGNDDFSFDDDLNFDDDMGLGFDDKSKPPPKNKREALMRTAGDVGKGFKDSFTDNKLKTAGQIASKAIPGKLRTEFDIIADTTNNIKDNMSKAANDLKKEAAKTTKLLKKVLPSGGKLGGWLQKIEEKLDDNLSKDKEASKEELQNQEIQAGILASLGELKEAQHADAMLNAAIQQKQNATTAELLQHIYAENKIMRNFHFEISQKYYRGSLELQFKNLFIQREMLELQKLQFSTFKNQFETIILNTSLPDIIKARSSELLKHQLNSRLRDSMINTMFNAMKPLQGFGQKLEQKISNTIKGVLGGLQGANEIGQQLQEASEMTGDMGMSKGYLAGGFIGDAVKNMLGKRIGGLISKSKSGKAAMFHAKDALADPRSALKKLGRTQHKGAVGAILKLISKAQTFAPTATMQRANYGRNNLDEAMIFDGRAHSSLVKVIPGLLSKIYGETKALRIGMKVQTSGKDYEVHFDHKSETFKTKTEMQRDLMVDLKRELDQNTKYATTRLTNALKSKVGINLNEKEAAVLSRAIAQYMMNPRATVNSQTLVDPAFWKTIQDPEVVKKLKGKAKRYRLVSMKDEYFQDDIIDGMHQVRNSMPNMNARYEELFRSGHADILSKMGVAKYDRISGNYYQDDDGVKNSVMRLWDNDKYAEKVSNSEQKKMRERAFGLGNAGNITTEEKMKNVESKFKSALAAGKEKGQGIWSNIKDGTYWTNLKGKAAEMKEAITKLDKASLAQYLSDKRNKLSAVVDSEFGAGTSNKIKKDVDAMQAKYVKAVQDLGLKIKNSTNQAARAEYMNRLGQISNTMIEYTNTLKDTKGMMNTITHNKHYKRLSELASQGKEKFDKYKTEADTAIQGKLHKLDTAYNIKLFTNIYSDSKTVATRAKDGVSKFTTKNFKAIKSLDSKTISTYFSSKASKVEDFIDKRFPGASRQMKTALATSKKKLNTVTERIQKSLDTVVDPHVRSELKLLQNEIKDVTSAYVKIVMSEGTNPAMQAEYEEQLKELTMKYNKILKDTASKNISNLGSILNNKIGSGLQKANAFYNNFREDPKAVLKKGFEKVKDFFAKERDIEDLKAEYFDSIEYKNGWVTSFTTWIRNMGYRIKGQRKKTLQKILATTRRWDRKMFFGIVKSPLKLLGGIFGKSKGKTLIGKVMGGTAKAGLKTTSLMLDMLPFGMGTLVKAPFMAMQTMASAVLGKQQEEKKEERKGGWMSRLKNLFGKKDETNPEKQKKGIMGWLKEHKKGIGIGLALTGVTMLLSKMGISLGDILGGVRKVVGAVYSIGQSIGNVIGSVMGVFGFGPKKPKIDKETGKPILDASGKPIMESDPSAVGKAAGAGVIGLLGLMAAKMFMNPFGTMWGLGKGVVKAAGWALKGAKWAGAAALSPFLKAAEIDAGNLKKRVNKNPIDPKTDKPKRGRPPKNAGKVAKATKDAATVAKTAQAASSGGSVAAKIGMLFSKLCNLPVIGGVLSKAKSKALSIAEKFGDMIAKFKDITGKITKKVGAKQAPKMVAKVGAFAMKVLGVVGIALVIWDIGWIIYYMLKGRSFWGAVTEQLLGTNLIDDEEELQKKVEAGDTPIDNAGGFISRTWEKTKELSQKAWDGTKEIAKKGWDSLKSGASAAWNAVKGGTSSAIEGVRSAGQSIVERFGLKSKGYLASKPLGPEDNKFPKESPSPYILPEKQSSMGGKRADVNGLTPETKTKLIAFAEQYYDMTGKPLPVTSAFRTREQQKAIWKQTYGFDATDNPDADRAKVKAMWEANGRKLNGVTKEGKLEVAHPAAGSPHFKGTEVDINIGATPFNSEAKREVKDRHPFLDNLAEAIGIKRPYSAWHNPKGGLRERWHFSANHEGNIALDPNTTDDVPKEEVKNLPNVDLNSGVRISDRVTRKDNNGVYESYAVSNPELQAINEANKKALLGASTSLETQAQAKTISYSSSSASDAISSVSASPSNISTSNNYSFNAKGIEDILMESYKVQSASMRFLKEIRDRIVDGAPSSSTTSNTTLPEPAVNLSRPGFENSNSSFGMI